MHKLHGHVLSICSIDEEDVEVCRPGDRGTVIHIEPDGMPLVRFHRTQRASLVDGDTEVVATRGTARALA